jgi:hypothetical protein
MPPWLPFAAILAVIAIVAGVAVLNSGGGSKKSAAAGAPTEVFLESKTSPGASPWTPTTALKAPSSTIPAATTTIAASAAPGTVSATKGTTPGLFGGTRQLASCDSKQMIDFLAGDQAKAKAWAQVEGIDVASLPTYIGSLTSVVLQADTRVTNHGFVNGVATPHQSVLEAGTAVLVDNTGVPRARCFCGNPLLPPQPVQQNFVGDQWPGFNPSALQVVDPGPPTDQLLLTDISDGSTIARRTGGDVSTDTVVSPGSSTTTTTAPTTTSTTTPTTTVAPGTNIASTGTATASTTFAGGQFPASNAVDGDLSTSWFSAGPDAGPTIYSWTAPDPTHVSQVTLTGNHQNADPSVRTKFGFGHVDVLIKNGDTVVLNSGFDGPGNAVQVVTIPVGATITSIVLTFSQGEDTTRSCGGFSELAVLA